MVYAKNINFIFTSKKLKCCEICFLCDQGFGEKKENIKWLEYEVKFMFSVKPTHFQINFIVKSNRLFKPRNKRIKRNWAGHGQ